MPSRRYQLWCSDIDGVFMRATGAREINAALRCFFFFFFALVRLRTSERMDARVRSTATASLLVQIHPPLRSSSPSSSSSSLLVVLVLVVPLALPVKHGGHWEAGGAELLRRLKRTRVPFAFMTNGGGGKTELEYALDLEAKLLDLGGGSGGRRGGDGKERRRRRPGLRPGFAAAGAQGGVHGAVVLAPSRATPG